MINASPQKRRRRLLRRRMTTAEQTLWSKLRSRRLAAYRFQRQASIDQYIVDFYCVEKKLIIEIDGAVQGLSSKQSTIKTVSYFWSHVDFVFFDLQMAM